MLVLFSDYRRGLWVFEQCSNYFVVLQIIGRAIPGRADDARYNGNDISVAKKRPMSKHSLDAGGGRVRACGRLPARSAYPPFPSLLGAMNAPFCRPSRSLCPYRLLLF